MTKSVVKIIIEKKIHPESLSVLKDFISFCQGKLSLKRFPDIYLHDTPKPKHGMTTGMYILGSYQLHALLGNRLLVDVLRTIAHELTHAKQYEEGSLNHEGVTSEGDRDINSDYENEAYEKAGNYVKEFVRHGIKMPKEQFYSLKEAITRLVDKSIIMEMEGTPQPVRKPFDIALPEDLLRISKLFQAAGKQFYLVGGAVRDALMGKEPKDLDVCTDAIPDDAIAILKQDPSLKILEIGKSFGVIKVLTPEGGEYEIATFRQDLSGGRRPDAVSFTTIDKDVTRRDLTINALFYDIERKEVVDYIGGIADIENNVVKAVGSPEERFEEDPLRILRAIRFAARMGSQMDPATSEAIKKNNNLQGVSGERIRDEFIKGIKSAKSVIGFYGLISEYNLWQQIFPGLNVSMDFKETNNVPVALGCLLRDNLPRVLEAKLNAMKYPAGEVAQIAYLSMFQGLEISHAYKLKKLFKNSRLSNEELGLFSDLVGKPNKALVDKFIKYEPSVSGSDLMAQGFSGKALGDEQNRLETEIFQSL